ncbi:hypothetical protein GCM10009817_27450 [Terrabacter lapilli]|uniref:Uncharacterized protein n=1 Tax=Terrabacter lapilli TaxID=436231 RepID=A0ABN2SCV0_9MICO
MVELIDNPRARSHTRALADAVVNAMGQTLPIVGASPTDGIPPDEPFVIELGADVPAPAVVLLDAGMADQEHHIRRWVRTYAADLGASLRGPSQPIGVQT